VNDIKLNSTQKQTQKGTLQLGGVGNSHPKLNANSQLWDVAHPARGGVNDIQKS